MAQFKHEGLKGTSIGEPVEIEKIQVLDPEEGKFGEAYEESHEFNDANSDMSIPDEL